MFQFQNLPLFQFYLKDNQDTVRYYVNKNLNCVDPVPLSIIIVLFIKTRKCILTLLNEKPTIKVKYIVGNGKLLKTKAKLSSVIIKLDEKRLTMVWSGYAKAIWPYMEE